MEEILNIVKTDSVDAAYNLALEEYLLEHERTGAYLLLWKNQQCIVVGKYQNAYEEVNLPAVEKQKVPVVRRSTGGGTVFHDLGNLNYSYITDYEPGTFSGYDAFITPLIKTLNRLGVPAEKRKHSDVVVCGKKISGSAQTIKKGRILHHGTLLFDADLTGLRTLLQPTEGRIESKAVKSVRSSVTNIKEYFTDKNMTLEKLEAHLTEGLAEGRMIKRMTLEKTVQEAVLKTAEEKYSSWDWNFGKSPDFTFYKESKATDYPIRVNLAVTKGRVAECSIRLGAGETEKEGILAQKIKGLPYSCAALESALRPLAGEHTKKFMNCFF